MDITNFFHKFSCGPPNLLKARRVNQYKQKGTIVLGSIKAKIKNKYGHQSMALIPL
jgi:hypothetical protein